MKRVQIGWMMNTFIIVDITPHVRHLEGKTLEDKM